MATKTKQGALAKQPDTTHVNYTSYDVAMRAGVSQSAVSRCFKEGAYVSEEMRSRVMKAAEELGYTPNAIARSLITRRSNLIAVLISNLTNLYYPEVLSELSRQFSLNNMRMLLFTLPSDSEVDRVLSQVWEYQVGGVIAAAAQILPRHVAEFERRRIPFVLYNRTMKDKAVSAVVCDQVEGARLLVSRLAAAGHKRFAIIDGPENSVVGQERTRGACDRLAELKLPKPLIVRGNYDYHSGAEGMRSILKQMGRAPDAVICGNDVMALGCVDAARHELGLAVPAKLSVAGFDGVEPAGWMSYQLTTLRQPVQEMARAATDLLTSMINTPGSGPEKRSFSAHFIEGTTARLGPADH